MDLITFTDGIQSIQIQDSDYPSVSTKTSERFVPLGQSVVQYTDNLFVAKHSNPELLRDLIAPTAKAGVEPNEFESVAISTMAALTALSLASNAEANESYRGTVQRALDVLNALQHDRQLLQSNLAALARV
jgi:hypothetical protein